MTLHVQPLEAPLGALVYGWNPSEDLPAADEAVIWLALQERQVLVFRGHAAPTDRELVCFAYRFGNLIKGSEWFGDIDPVAEILRVNNLVGDDGVAQGTGASTSLEWHADYSYVPTVGRESFLEAVEIPSKNPPQTCFANQYAAFASLPKAMAEMLRPLYAHHSITGYSKEGDQELQITGEAEGAENFRDSFRAKKERNARLGIARPPIPKAIHPLVMRHPDTGREILYVSKGITRNIIGMPQDESSAAERTAQPLDAARKRLCA